MGDMLCPWPGSLTLSPSLLAGPAASKPVGPAAAGSAGLTVGPPEDGGRVVGVGGWRAHGSHAAGRQAADCSKCGFRMLGF